MGLATMMGTKRLMGAWGRAVRRLAFALLVVSGASAAAAEHPRLAVLLVFDQVRSSDLDRLEPLFGPGGFGGLMARNAARFDAVYSYAGAETAPGHATLSTGANPVVHGIAGNVWYASRQPVYVVDDPSAPVFGADGGTGRSARFLRAGTLGDALKLDSRGASKVVAISIKDRAAILSAGPSGDLVLWYDADQGRYLSSSAFGERLPAWAETLGRQLPAASLASGRWSALPVSKAQATLVGPDDGAGEASPDGFSTQLPHDLQSVADPAVRRRAYRATPQSMEDLFALARAAVEQEKLGTRGVADLLIVSVSTTDYAGHTFGPQSQEYADLLRRADALVRGFIAGLDKAVGRNGYVMAVTSDHGSCPLPEQSRAVGVPAGRIRAEDIVSSAQAAVAGVVGAEPKRVLGFVPPQLFFDFDDLSPELRLRALLAASEALERLPGVARVCGDFADRCAGDPFSSLMKQSRAPGRYGDLMIRPSPHFVFAETGYPLGTDHSSPYLYDRTVPLFLTGPGVRGGRYAQSADPRDVAPTLAFLLGAPAPESADGSPLPAVGAAR